MNGDEVHEQMLWVTGDTDPAAVLTRTAKMEKADHTQGPERVGQLEPQTNRWGCMAGRAFRKAVSGEDSKRPI